MSGSASESVATAPQPSTAPMWGQSACEPGAQPIGLHKHDVKIADVHRLENKRLGSFLRRQRAHLSLGIDGRYG